MAHTRKKTKLLARVSRLKGQMDAIQRALVADTPCAEVLNLAASVRGAMNGLIGELIEDHIREHVADSSKSDTTRTEGVSELIEVIRRYLG